MACSTGAGCCPECGLQAVDSRAAPAFTALADAGGGGAKGRAENPSPLLSAAAAEIPQDARAALVPGTPAPDAGGSPKPASPVAKPAPGMGVGSPIKNCYCVCLCVPRTAFLCFGIHLDPPPADQADILPAGPPGSAGAGTGGVGGSSPAPAPSPAFPGVQGQIGGTSIVSGGMVGLPVPALLPMLGSGLRHVVVPPVGPGIGGGLGPAGAGGDSADRIRPDQFSAARRITYRDEPRPVAEPPVHRQPSTPPLEYAATSGTPRLPSAGGAALGVSTVLAAVIPDDSPRRGWVALASRRAPPPVHPPHAGAFDRGLDHGSGAGILPDPEPWYEDGMASTPIGREAAAEFEEPGQGPAVALLEPPERQAVRPVHGTREFLRRDGVMTSGLPGDAVADLPASVSIPSPLQRQASAWRTDLGAGLGKERAVRGVADGPASPGARKASGLSGGLLGARSAPEAGLGGSGGAPLRPSIRPSIRPSARPSLGIHTGGGGGGGSLAAAGAALNVFRQATEQLDKAGQRVDVAHRQYELAQRNLEGALKNEPPGSKNVEDALKVVRKAHDALREEEARRDFWKEQKQELGLAKWKAGLPFQGQGSDKEGQSRRIEEKADRQWEYENRFGARHRERARERQDRRLRRMSGGARDTWMAERTLHVRADVAQRRDRITSMGARIANAKNSRQSERAWKARAATVAADDRKRVEAADRKVADAEKSLKKAEAREAEVRELESEVDATEGVPAKTKAAISDASLDATSERSDAQKDVENGKKEAARTRDDQKRRERDTTHAQRVSTARAARKAAKLANKALKRAQKAHEKATRYGDERAKKYWTERLELLQREAEEKEEDAKRATEDVEGPPDSPPEPESPPEAGAEPKPRDRNPVDVPTFITGPLTPENPVDEGEGCGEKPDCGKKPCPECLEPEEFCAYCFWFPVPVAQKGAGVGGGPKGPADSGQPEARFLPRPAEVAPDLAPDETPAERAKRERAEEIAALERAVEADSIAAPPDGTKSDAELALDEVSREHFKGRAWWDEELPLPPVRRPDDTPVPPRRARRYRDSNGQWREEAFSGGEKATAAQVRESEAWIDRKKAEAQDRLIVESYRLSEEVTWEEANAYFALGARDARRLAAENERISQMFRHRLIERSRRDGWIGPAAVGSLIVVPIAFAFGAPVVAKGGLALVEGGQALTAKVVTAGEAALVRLVGPAAIEFGAGIGGAGVTGYAGVAGAVMGAALGVPSARAVSQLERNIRVGNAWRDEIAARFRAAGFEVKIEQVKRTLFGRRVIDIEVWKDGRRLGGIETKSGLSEYGPVQRAKDKYLRIMEDYIVNVVREPRTPPQ